MCNSNVHQQVLNVLHNNEKLLRELKAHQLGLTRIARITGVEPHKHPQLKSGQHENDYIISVKDDQPR